MRGIRIRWIALVLVLWGIIGLATPVRADTPVARVLYFYTPTCPFCQIISRDHLPPLREQYGAQLSVLEVDSSQRDGGDLFRAAIARYSIPPERQGVPMMIVGDTVLVGAVEIPQQLPGLVAAGLQAGGIDWPDLPGIEEFAARAPTTTGPTLAERLAQDPAGNTVAVILLAAMLILLPFLLQRGRWQYRLARRLPSWATFVDGAVGLGAALYLTYVDTRQVEAFCGPVGRCNIVQQTEFAYVFGVIPLALIGVLGYIALLSTYAYKRWGKGPLVRYAPLAFFAMAWFGFLTSVVLTYLQPFVIGATCFWCLTSAVSMTLMLTFNVADGWDEVHAWRQRHRTARRRARRKTAQTARSRRA